MISGVNLCKYYYDRNSRKKIKILDKVNINIHRNESIAVMGKSGSGKTTLAKIILRLEKTDEGNIYFFNKDITCLHNKDLYEFRRNVQYIPQKPETFLDPILKLEYSLNEPLKVFNLQVDNDEIKRILEVVKLNFDILQRYPHQVSGGEIQRICLARALLLKPKLLVLDEPTSMLDVSVQAQILNLLKNIRRYEKLSYLFITHDLQLAKFLCDKILFLENCKLQSNIPIL